MPAKSEKRALFMRMCLHNPKHAKGKCPSRKVAKEFSRTKKDSLEKLFG